MDENGIKLRCKRCGYVWMYKGKNPYYTSCPYCKTTVKVVEYKEE